MSARTEQLSLADNLQEICADVCTDWLSAAEFWRILSLKGNNDDSSEKESGVNASH
jgi:hypothetical protein